MPVVTTRSPGHLLSGRASSAAVRARSFAVCSARSMKYPALMAAQRSPGLTASGWAAAAALKARRAARFSL